MDMHSKVQSKKNQVQSCSGLQAEGAEEEVIDQQQKICSRVGFSALAGPWRDWGTLKITGSGSHPRPIKYVFLGP